MVNTVGDPDGRLRHSTYRITGGPDAYGLRVERDGVRLTTVTAIKVEAVVKGLVQVTLTEYAEVEVEVDAVEPTAGAET